MCSLNVDVLFLSVLDLALRNDRHFDFFPTSNIIICCYKYETGTGTLITKMYCITMPVEAYRSNAMFKRDVLRSIFRVAP